MLIDWDKLGHSPGVTLLSPTLYTSLAVTDYTSLGLENKKLYLGDYGHVFYIYTGADLSTALETSLRIKKPDGTLVNWTPTLHTFGITYNYLTYTIYNGDLDQVGLWELQTYAKFNGWIGRGNTIDFQIWPVFT